jgi:hypothetical protein
MNAQAGIAWDNSGGDPEATMSAFISTGTNQTAMAHITANGNVTFDLYVMTEHDYDSYKKGLNYSVEDAFTNLNVTSVNVTAELEKGRYVILINTHSAGRVELSDQYTVIEPPTSIPWDVVGAVIITGVLSSAVIAIIISRRQRK